MAVIGDAEHEVRPGDFMGFPIDGTPTHCATPAAAAISST